MVSKSKVTTENEKIGHNQKARLVPATAVVITASKQTPIIRIQESDSRSPTGRPYAAERI